MDGDVALIRVADRDGDRDALWRMLEPTLRAADTYAVDRDIGRDDALRWWMGGGREVFVAVGAGTAVGSYYLVRNHGGGGSHVANAGYVVAPDARGRGVGRAMCAHSLERARERGFHAMQFNLVVATNTSAIRLWESMGFRTVGTIPAGFDHPVHGLVDALVMYREL